MTITGPTLSPVSLLCTAWAPSQFGNLEDFQHLQITHFSPDFISIVFTTFADVKSILLLILWSDSACSNVVPLIHWPRDCSIKEVAVSITTANNNATRTCTKIDILLLIFWGENHENRTVWPMSALFDCLHREMITIFHCRWYQNISRTIEHQQKTKRQDADWEGHGHIFKGYIGVERCVARASTYSFATASRAASAASSFIRCVVVIFLLSCTNSV